MTNDAIRRKIAEACGWKFHGVIIGVPLMWPPSGGDACCPPNYPESHDAMAEALDSLGGHERQFARELVKIVCADRMAGQIFFSNELFRLIDATPLQKAEAFLRAKGLWEEKFSGPECPKCGKEGSSVNNEFWCPHCDYHVMGLEDGE